MDWSALLLDSTDTMTAVALLLGRVAIGVCFVIHGLGKLGLVGTAPDDSTAVPVVDALLVKLEHALRRVNWQ